MIKKEKKSKEFVILLFKKVWVKVVLVLEELNKIKIGMMKIFDLFDTCISFTYYSILFITIININININIKKIINQK